ncbi:MAG: hypothetical protein ACTSYD_15035 [Candidatus Heimdallarchaeaceae archaeon]
MVAPFSNRHPKAFQHSLLIELCSNLSKDRDGLQQFVESSLELMKQNNIPIEVKDVLIDVAICIRNFDKILELTKTLDYPEHYLYRAYAYSRRQETNKIVSLKLNFQQKFVNALTLPRNKFIITAMEFLLLYGEQNFTMALTAVEDLEKIYLEAENEIGDKLYTQLMLTLIAQAYLMHSSFDKVNNTARKILQVAVKQKDPYFQSVALNLMTTVLISKGEFRKAQRMLNSAIVPTEKTGLKTDRASLLNNAAKLEMARGNYSRSIRLLETIANLIEDNPRGLAITLINIAELNILLGDRVKAREALAKATELEKKYDLNLIEPYLMSAWLEVEEHDYVEARNYLDICEEMLKETGERRQKPLVYYYEGLLAKREDRYDAAIEWFEKAIDVSRKMLNIEILIKGQFQLAAVYFEKFKETRELSEFSNVLKYLNNLIVLSKEQFIPKLQCDIHILKGLILAETGKRERAVKELLQAHTLAQKFKYNQIVQDANNILKNIEKIKTEELESKVTLANFGFREIDKMNEVLEKYQGFKFIKTPKKVHNKIYGIAIVKRDTGSIKYRYRTEYEENEEASLVPTIIAAVNMFSKQLFEDEIELSNVKDQNKEILIDAIGQYLVILIADKISFDITTYFERFIDQLKGDEKLLLTLKETKEANNEELDKIIKDTFAPVLKERKDEEKDEESAELNDKNENVDNEE